MATESLRILICLESKPRHKKPCMIPLLANNEKFYKKLIQLSKQKLQNKVKSKVKYNYFTVRTVHSAHDCVFVLLL